MFTALNRLGNLLHQFSDSVEITGISVAMTGTSLVKGKAKEHFDWPDVVFTKDNTVSVGFAPFEACRSSVFMQWMCEGNARPTTSRCGVTGDGAHRSPGMARTCCAM